MFANSYTEQDNSTNKRMFAKIGSVSTGTLKTADLLNAFCEQLEWLARSDQDEDRKAAVAQAVADAKKALEEGAETVQEEFVQESGHNLLSSYAAPYCYFGTHEGDGSDFGFWPSIEALENDARYEDGVVKVNAGDDWPELADDIFYVMEVSDHGNVSLYEASTKNLIWDCV